MKSLQKEQIYYYDPQSAGINVKSPQSESTPRRLTLDQNQPLFKSPWQNNIYLAKAALNLMIVSLA